MSEVVIHYSKQTLLWKWLIKHVATFMGTPEFEPRGSDMVESILPQVAEWKLGSLFG